MDSTRDHNDQQEISVDMRGQIKLVKLKVKRTVLLVRKIRCSRLVHVPERTFHKTKVYYIDCWFVFLTAGKVTDVFV